MLHAKLSVFGLHTDGISAIWEGREYTYPLGIDISTDMNSNAATRAAYGCPKLHA